MEKINILTKQEYCKNCEYADEGVCYIEKCTYPSYMEKQTKQLKQENEQLNILNGAYSDWQPFLEKQLAGYRTAFETGTPTNEYMEELLNEFKRIEMKKCCIGSGDDGYYTNQVDEYIDKQRKFWIEFIKFVFARTKSLPEYKKLQDENIELKQKLDKLPEIINKYDKQFPDFPLKIILVTELRRVIGVNVEQTEIYTETVKESTESRKETS